MKFAVVFACLVAAAAAQIRYDPNYYNRNQYNRYSTYRPFVPVTTPAPFFPVPVSTVAPFVPKVVPKVITDARAAGIVKYGNEINPDSSYNFFYETENGIAAQEQGVPRDFGGNPPVVPVVAQGSFSYTSPEGIPVGISYTADENGFQATGNAIPTPHPIPELIARSLEFIAKNSPIKK